VAPRAPLKSMTPVPTTVAIQRRAVINSIPPPPKIEPPEAVKFVTSGSTSLDLILGGGWGQGRVVNVVGDKSAGKTMLAIEACANFALQWGIGQIRYAEAEDAFDARYASSIGMPAGLKPVEGIRTIEAWYADMEKWLATRTNGSPCLYVLDSLDSLSDAAELDRAFDNDATYGQGKAKKTSELFRRLIQPLGAANCTLMVISQIRDNIGVTFGDKHKRSGGKALDFYCSQVVWLAQISRLSRVIRGEQRVIGSRVLAKTKKNKIGIPFREIELQVIFSYGIDDEMSLLGWLKKTKNENKLPADYSAVELEKLLIQARTAQDRATVKLIHGILSDTVREQWLAIEADLAPPMSKYV
jgi:protein RecA